MQQVKNFTAILIIALLGFTIGSDVFSAHADSILCAGDAHSVADSGISAKIKVKDTATSTQSDCNDPCHLGQCHFGHCSFSFSESSIRFHAVDRSIKREPRRRAEFIAPVLEGLRRPPRNA